MIHDTQTQILIEQRVNNDAKSVVVAYLMLVFLGGFGAHRFYLGRPGTAVTMLVLFVLGWATLAFGIGLIPLGVVGIWALVDLFLIPGMVRANQQALRQKLAAELGTQAPESLAPGHASPAVTG
ncbi:MAG: TM2 domain-containing protein [Paracoccus sp. (in: a-proteobacteria)]|nr:TM2 domain-containing protein [Paracoccus sp. (in: a-proteobacteria)]